MSEVVERGERQEAPRSERGTVLRPGALIGRYVVLHVLGRGGMGVVYAAYDSQLDRRVAIKLLHGAMTDTPEGRARLLGEAQAMARLSHPNVVAIHDVGAFGDSVFLAMDFVDGATLRQWLATPRAWSVTLEVLVAAGRGLAAAHAAGLVHCDFKPDNVMVGNDGRVMVMDFGIAHTRVVGERSESLGDQAYASVSSVAATPGGSEASSLSGRLTETGNVLGTVGYIAPEQLWGKGVDARSDQFSFCVTLYAALYGERAYPGRDLAAYVTAVETTIPDPPKGGPVPAFLRKVLLRGMSRSPQDRYPSMDAMLAALQKNPWDKRRRWIAAAAVLMAGSLALAVYARQQGAQRLVCVGDAQLAGVWDGPSREEVRRAFLATGAPRAGDTTDRVVRSLDAYASAWATMVTESCEATKVRKTQSEDLRQLRVSCLDRRKTELAALVSVLRTADTEVVSRALDATYGLVFLEWCANTNSLRAAVGLPDDPAKRGRVLGLRGRLAHARSLVAAGKSDEGLRVARDVLGDVRGIPHAGTEAETLCFVADTERERADFGAAETAYKAAAWAAERANNPALLARAASRLAHVQGTTFNRYRDASEWMSWANAARELLPGNEEVEADVLSEQAALLGVEGHPEEAVSILFRVQKILERVLGREHLRVADVNVDISQEYHDLGEHAKALDHLERALSIEEGSLGADHPSLASDYGQRGYILIDLGRYEEAARSVRRAMDVWERVGPTSVRYGWTLQLSSRISTLTGNAAAGATAARRSIAIFEANAGLHGRYMADSLVALGHALATQGLQQESLEACERALSLQEGLKLRPEKVYESDALTCVGEAHLALGKVRDALAPLEQSVKLARRVYPGDLARARFALARALSQAEPKSDRPLSLARAARGELAQHTFLKARTDEVDRWIATRDVR